MTDQPRVSIIMPTYNCGPYIAEAIDSALAQGYDDFELLICDDGSTDDTAAVLKAYEQDERVRVFAGRRKGVGAARNRLLEQASGKYIAFLDSDDVWKGRKLAEQVGELEASPNAAICHTATEMFDGETGDGPIVEERRARIQGDCFEAQFRQTGLIPSAAVLRRSMMPSHGFYEDMPTAEDYALFLETLWGRTAIYRPDLLTLMRRRPGQATADRGKRLQVYNGLARLRALRYLRDRTTEATAAPLRAWALEELKTCAYSRYWSGDYRIARLGFAWLAEFGESTPWRHRMRAAIGAMMGGR